MNPEDFVSFADYAALNAEDVQRMLDRQLAERDRLQAEAEKAQAQHYEAAQGAGEGTDVGTYERTGEAARRGLASYGDFLRGMADPAHRQALMEKLYGRGSVSALDSALVGARGAGQFGEGAAQSAQSQYDARTAAADARRGRYREQSAAQKAEDERYQAQQQAEADEREKDRLGKAYWMSNFNRPGSENWTQRDKEMFLNEMYGQGKGSWRRPGGGTYQLANGRYDWDAIDRDSRQRRHEYWVNRPKTFWGAEIEPWKAAPPDPADETDTWANYYERNKRKGAK